MKGIGARLAVDLNERYSSETLFILIARDEAKLESVIKEDSFKPTNRYCTLKIDFSNDDDYKKEIENILKKEDLKYMSELFVFYNHGTLNLLKIEDAAKISTQFYQINVISVWKLLAAILALFPINENLKQYHINTSSKMAFVHLPLYSLYTSSKYYYFLLF